jgi:capsular exopolysaccharide synthesis family protein
VSFASVFRLLLRRWPFLLVPLVVVPAVALIVANQRPEEYRSTALLLVEPNDPGQALASVGEAVAQLRDPDRFIESQIIVIESESLAARTAARVNEESVIVDRRLTASQTARTDVLAVTYTSRRAERAAQVANAAAEEYVDVRVESQVGTIDFAIAEIERELTTLDSELTQLAADIRLAEISLSDTAVLAVRQATAEARFTELSQRRSELLVDKSLKRGDATIIERAQESSAPIGMSASRIALLSVVLGLVVGIGAVALAERFDDRIRTEADLAGLNVRLLATLPFDRTTRSAPRERGYVASIEQPLGAMAEAVRQLRTTIQFFGIDQPIDRLLITSTVPGEGKSAIVANLGVAMAQSGSSVTVVSSDVRRPTVERVLGLPFPNEYGVTSVINEVALTGSLEPSLSAAIVKPGVPNLAVLPAGPAVPYPTDLLASRAAADIFDATAEMSDMLLVDTPPLLAVADTLVIGRNVPTVIVVVAAGRTSKPALKRALHLLEPSDFRLLGVVLNMAGSHTRQYGYGYGYVDRNPRRFGGRKRDRTRVQAAATLRSGDDEVVATETVASNGSVVDLTDGRLSDASH